MLYAGRGRGCLGAGGGGARGGGALIASVVGLLVECFEVGVGAFGEGEKYVFDLAGHRD